MKYLLVFALLCGPCCPAAVVIPIDLEKGNAIADARINGVAVRVGIDSGGGPVSLKREVLEKVSATPTGSARSATDTLGHTSSQALYKLDTLELGGHTFADVEGGEEGAYAAAGGPAGGTVGRKFLNQFLVVYDYPSRKITLHMPKERKNFEQECHGISVRGVPDPEDLMVSTAIIDNGTMRMLWDTGATYSFVKKTVAEERKLRVEEVFYTSQTFKLGKKDFGPLKFVVLDAKAPAGADGYIGYNFFLTHVVCIDPFEHVIKVAP